MRSLDQAFELEESFVCRLSLGSFLITFIFVIGMLSFSRHGSMVMVTRSLPLLLFKPMRSSLIVKKSGPHVSPSISTTQNRPTMNLFLPSF
jgi:hypothetical protein